MDKIRYYRPRGQPKDDNSDSDVDLSEVIYSLEIVQQPQRARMCGFGDKDRRNITPAPVLKLIAKTADGKLVPTSNLSRQAFVVNADLWLEDEVTERNLVLISSISNRPSNRSVSSKPTDLSENWDDHSAFSGSKMQLHLPQNQLETSHLSSTLKNRPIQSSHDENISNHGNRWRSTQDDHTTDQGQQRSAKEAEQMTNEHYPEEKIEWEAHSAQNLVGQTTVGGQTAPDLDDKTSYIWFAFSMLSIRTEGVFKLRFSLFDLMQRKGTATPVMYRIFSDPIHVQSPKKFIGTCDNNEIANHLNKYSIRIPSRKDEKH
ncbi:hypothetical protein BX616_009862 [Lobosporangium transversale]|uniref:Velvet factor n=1 Tax=Lobosporangium transversale TaxID=64571 RepID=A0A1Y2H064_9FUNG|nr:velvet factor [Lobosporangium transversale]KAF9913572.1 hypothetical protein BX616_009862 [Lobosporangium transversale]ORZ27103.1 velvet factor [Lobosporangium transversale]|eukprot:XP_021884850.1 velvet factor [Lobosporangium transversale]